ncbi:MAG: phosphodiester glycosidase family protein [Clostridia bacterium]|nr:phosphodiester glycosidase family protein [Clostridia bacterium]
MSDINNEKKKRLTGLQKTLICIVSILVALALVYCTAVFSNIPFIKKWRNIYIETAMTTGKHQWLATAFIPGYIIDDVMEAAMREQALQEELESKWEQEEETEEEETPPVNKTEEDRFYEKFWEVDKTKLRKYMSDKKISMYDNLLIENLDDSINITTTFGEKIRVLDSENNLLIVEVVGEQYKGLLAVIKNPGQVTIAKSKALGSHGNIITKFAKDNNALVAINASGFLDEEYKGNGGTVMGSMVLDGVEYGNPLNELKFFGFKQDNRLYIENYDENTISEYKWGIQFSPALIVDGEKYVQGTFGYGLQPRSAVGQTLNGEFLMLVIDGRQVGHSIGATVNDLAEIMRRHKSYQAMNLDGGSSSIMNYRGKTISKPSSKNNLGRYLPNAFICQFASDAEKN